MNAWREAYFSHYMDFMLVSWTLRAINAHPLQFCNKIHQDGKLTNENGKRMPFCQ